MDRTNRAVASRKSRTNARNARGTYVEGNAVRKIQEMPARQRTPVPGRQPGRQRAAAKPASQSARRVRQVSRETIRNRQKAKSMGRGFVVFLTAVCVAILFFAVNYLQLKSDITGKIKDVAALETEYSELKEDNDAYYSQVTSNVDLNKIKRIAIGRLGMNYPTDEQKKTYTMSSNSYVRQYQDIPESKR
ncbi:MAG TPA: hypothetical protein IAA05_02925 [Candidatus Blautia excrementipullorum]|nr:hypothetical protein [Candidatus Blautia excrementipullorum]